MVIDDKSLDILIPPGAVDEMSADAQAQAITDRKNLYTVANECAAVVRSADSTSAFCSVWLALRLCRPLVAVPPPSPRRPQLTATATAVVARRSAAVLARARRRRWCNSSATARRPCARLRSVTAPTTWT